MNGICPNCENFTEQQEFVNEEEFNIRGEKILVAVKLFKCLKCGEKFEDPQSHADPIDEAYREYRRRKGFLQPEEIQNFRRKYGLTQAELNNILGWGGATLSRYENGALQSEAHDQLLKLVMQPENLLHILREKQNLLPPEKRAELFKKIETEAESSSPLLNAFEDKYRACDPDIYSGYKHLDISRLINAILFFSSGEGVSKTKLNKMLYYADFLHFKHYTVSITGASYARLPFGPVPDHYHSLFAALIDENKVIHIEERGFPEYSGEYVVADVKPDLSIFNTTELKIMATIKEIVEPLTARQISEQSHWEKGYLETATGHLIPYSYAEEIFLDEHEKRNI